MALTGLGLTGRLTHALRASRALLWTFVPAQRLSM